MTKMPLWNDGIGALLTLWEWYRSEQQNLQSTELLFRGIDALVSMGLAIER